MTKPKPRQDPQRTYGYLELADLIEQQLGIRPSLSTLRSAAARPADPALSARLTTGMPQPLPPHTKPARFDADAIDDWLDHHPMLTHRIRDQRLHDLTTAVGHSDTNAIPHAVTQARKAGASWSAITTALQAGGWPHGRTWAYRIYKDTQA